MFKDHIQRCQLRVDCHAQVGGGQITLFLHHVRDHKFQQLKGQMAAEEQVGQLLAHHILTQLPGLFGLIAEGIFQPFHALGLDGLVAYLCLKGDRINDAAVIQLLAHAHPYAWSHNGILSECQHQA
ncbi:hypothetical protein SDC9_148736 [bioreactor metagenome]|uniref:Uncharacterized protein n=1 Tax=bioreactor metagenome TaxID=1076179 RepID=A0A645EIE2_9ZZZZ